MAEIEQYMRTLKLGGLAKDWRSVEFHAPEQYVTDLLKLELHEREVNRINRAVKESLIYSDACLTVAFPPSAAFPFLDLPPVNLRNAQLHLSKNPSARQRLH